MFLAPLLTPDPALSATLPNSNMVTLAWDSSPSPAVAGYRVYLGTASGNYTTIVEVGNVTTNTVPGLTNGVTYFMAVTAYDTNGLESAFSNEISVVPGLTRIQVHVAANRQAVLTLSGPIGHTYDIQATADLRTWTAIGNVTVGSGGSFDFTDTNAPIFPKRFYRTHEIQP